MPSADETIARITQAPSWDKRVAQLRTIPQKHGTNEHTRIYAAIARAVYVPHLSPDFAYIHSAPFYEEEYFKEVYESASSLTENFSRISEDDLSRAIARDPRTLSVFRTIMGLTKDEFAQSTKLAGEPIGIGPLSSSKVDSMEKKGTAATEAQARVAAKALSQIIEGSLFGDPPENLVSKQAKPDTRNGWATVSQYATNGVPYYLFLHQRHYGGAFRQVLDATSSRRGDRLEDAVESLFVSNGIPYIRTGSHNQAEIAKRFEVRVVPAPDFVVFDNSGALRAMLECKGTNDGGTARDKALRFERLRDESIRLGGVPLVAVLGGTGWARVNDTLGPVVRDTDGRVFTPSTIGEMLEVAPFPSLVGLQR